jgi:peptidoglycan/xylan/chitin deacetylase (PgdA/CDA1 family)
VNFWSFIGKTFLPQLTWRREVKDKVVYLTFDDGPHPEVTPWVMEELARYDAKGTFFLVGENVTKYPNVVSSLKENGHEIGNHTQHHLKGWGKSKAKYLDNIHQCELALGEKRLFRPPYGQINFRAMGDICSEYEVIMWDIITMDFLPSINSDKALKRIKKATTSGSIIVFHDSEKAEKNLKKMLPDYLQFLKKEGYKMEVL